MSYDYEQQPEFAGPGREPAGATGVRFPEDGTLMAQRSCPSEGLPEPAATGC
jgi:hypothetical protein